MKGKSYTKELKEEILREVQEVGSAPFSITCLIFFPLRISFLFLIYLLT